MRSLKKAQPLIMRCCPNDITQDRLNRMLIKYNAVNISSGVQQNYGISNNVIYFSTAAIAKFIPAFKDIPVDSVLKIRIMSSERMMVIPFVLFPELTIEELESLYSIVSNNCTDKLANVDNALVSYENKMKFISYYFSELLAEVFFCAEDINGIKKQTQRHSSVFKMYRRNFFSEK